MKNVLFVRARALALTLVAVGCFGSSQLAAASPPAGYNLTWAEEFNGTPGALPSNTWAGFSLLAPDGWSGLLFNANILDTTHCSIFADAAATDGKALQISATNSSGYQSAGIQTHFTHTITYGYIEVRAKVPAGQGVWPGIWMFGNDLTGATWPQMGEMDLVDITGSANYAFQNFYAGALTVPTPWSSYKYSGGSYSGAYHTFGLLWSQTGITSYVDGAIVQHHTSLEPGWSFNHPFSYFLALNLGGRAGNISTSMTNPTAFPQNMYIDYIREYTGPQTNSPSGGPQVVDPLTNFFFIYNTGGYLKFDTLNSANFGGHASRLTRSSNQPTYINYKYNSISSYSFPVYTTGLPNAGGVSVFYSTDHGVTYTPSATMYTAPVATAGGWEVTTLSNLGAMPSGVTDLKIQLASTNTATDTEIGQITIVHAMTPVVPLGGSKPIIQ
jgi:beta-glucanase (GH16 family)